MGIIGVADNSTLSVNQLVVSSSVIITYYYNTAVFLGYNGQSKVVLNNSSITSSI